MAQSTSTYPRSTQGWPQDAAKRIINSRGARAYFAGDEICQQFVPVMNFSPSDLSDLAVWLETSPLAGSLYTDTTLSTQAVDTNTIKGWKDLSGNGLKLTEATNGPTLAYPADETDGVNGRGYLNFDGTNDVLTGGTAADWNFLHNGTGMTLFGVAAPEEGVNCLLFDTTVQSSGIGALLWVDDGTGGSAGRAGLSIRDSGGSIGLIQATADADVHPGGEFHCLAGTMKTGEAANVYVDGCLVATGALSGTPTATVCGQAMKLGHGVSTAFDADKYCAMIAYKRVLSLAEIRRVTRYLAARYGFPCHHIACLGDSITSGERVTTTYPQRLAQRLGPLWTATNYGHSGDKIADQYTNFWLTTAGAAVHRHNFVSVLAGVNDIGQGQTATQIIADLTTLYNAILTNGYGRKLIVNTIMPWGAHSAWTSGLQAIQDTANAFIRNFAATTNDVALSDLESVMRSPTNSTQLNPLFQVEGGLHPNQAGSDVIAACVADAAQSLAVPSVGP